MTSTRRWKLGTRGSALALAQANEVLATLEKKLPNIAQQIEIVTIQTSGDKHPGDEDLKQAAPGFFVKEIEQALLQNKIDFAVHSLKDLPSQDQPELILAAHLPRIEAADVLCGKNPQQLKKIAQAIAEGGSDENFNFATSSPRRAAFLKHFFRNCHMQPMRGNVDTRLGKMMVGDVDATLLAYAGLQRLHRLNPNFCLMDKTQLVPAAAQGIVAVQCRRDDMPLQESLKIINNSESQRCAQAERAFMATIGAGCHNAVGAFAHRVGEQLVLNAMIIALDGQQRLQQQLSGPLQSPMLLGQNLAHKLLHAGAGEILS